MRFSTRDPPPLDLPSMLVQDPKEGTGVRVLTTVQELLHTEFQTRKGVACDRWQAWPESAVPDACSTLGLAVALVSRFGCDTRGWPDHNQETETLKKKL